MGWMIERLIVRSGSMRVYDLWDFQARCGIGCLAKACGMSYFK